MKRRSKTAIVLAAILAALLMLGVVLPILSAPALAAWYDSLGPGMPSWNDLDPKLSNWRYRENIVDADLVADDEQYHGRPIIYDIGMELAKDGNIKLVSDVRWRFQLSYSWQAWSDKGTEVIADDGWVNIDEATEPTFRPADFMQNGPQMVRLQLAHASGGADFSIPIIITLTDGVGESEAFTGDMAALVKSIRERGYIGGAHATEDGIEIIEYEALV